MGIGAYKTFSLLQFTQTGYKNFTSVSILQEQLITKIKTQRKLSSYEWRMRWLGNWNVGHLLHYGSPFLPNARSDRTASCAAVVSGPPCAGLRVVVLPPGRRLRCQRWWFWTDHLMPQPMPPPWHIRRVAPKCPRQKQLVAFVHCHCLGWLELVF